ncbi:MAG: glycosyltransferase [Paludibacteraceae bacterium]|nr:glycosyltransferase [Paludibacteraceae bacterium]
MIRISYIIPCYNCSEFITDTLCEIIAHINLSAEEYEILCVDDCSMDNTFETIKHFSVQYPQVKVIKHKVNLRQGGARNTGIKAAKGKYIGFGDHDDRLPEFDLKSLLDEMDEHNLDMLMCDVNFQLEDKSMIQTPGLNSAIDIPVTGVQVYDDGYMIKGGMLGVWSSLYRKEYVSSLPDFAEHVRVEDADWMMRAIGNAQRIEYRPIAIYNWMFYLESQSHEMSAEMRADIIRRGFRQIEVAMELSSLSQKAYDYCYEDGIQSIKTATNALWKKYTPLYRYRFMKSLSLNERNKILSLKVNKRCDILFKYPISCLALMACTSLVCIIIGKK